MCGCNFSFKLPRKKAPSNGIDWNLFDSQHTSIGTTSLQSSNLHLWAFFSFSSHFLFLFPHHQKISQLEIYFIRKQRRIVLKNRTLSTLHLAFATPIDARYAMRFQVAHYHSWHAEQTFPVTINEHFVIFHPPLHRQMIDWWHCLQTRTTLPFARYSSRLFSTLSSLTIRADGKMVCLILFIG